MQGDKTDLITQIAGNSEISRYHWKDRGIAPKGYILGMAVLYARDYSGLKLNKAAINEMAKPETGDINKDALAWYKPEFLFEKMENKYYGVDTLRHLFVLLTGLGMRESSGRYCEGRDMAAANKNGETAEAGLFQTSYNSRIGSPLMVDLLHTYANSTDFISLFKVGIRCTATDLKNFGVGKGREFQRLTKACPAFAVEFAAVGLRNIRTHWGPINRKEVEIRGACDDMLKEVQQAVDRFDLSYFANE